MTQLRGNVKSMFTNWSKYLKKAPQMFKKLEKDEGQIIKVLKTGRIGLVPTPTTVKFLAEVMGVINQLLDTNT